MAMAMAWPHRKPRRPSVRSEAAQIGWTDGREEGLGSEVELRAPLCSMGQLNAQQTHAPLRCPFQLSAVPVQCLCCVQLQQGPGSPGKGT